MIESTNNLLSLEQAGNELILSLRKSGKHECAKFFQGLLFQFANGSQSERDDALESISKCAAIAQYADFSPDEERRLHQLVSVAISILEAI